MRAFLIFSKNGNDKKCGFTLIELMVVMVILGFLITIMLSTFQTSQKKTRDAQRKSDLRQISEALELYNNDFGRYPRDIGDHQIRGCGADADEACVWGEIFQNTSNNTVYMIDLPADPKSGRVYFYEGVGSGSEYQIYARLENLDDNDVPKNGDTPQIYSGTSCGSGLGCNYGVSSPNKEVDDGHVLVDDPDV